MDRAFGIIGLVVLFIPPLLYILGFMAICLTMRTRSIMLDILSCLATLIPFLAIGGLSIVRFSEFILAHALFFGVFLPVLLGVVVGFAYAGWKSTLSTNKNS